MRVGGDERLIAAEDAGRYRDALGAMPPSGLPEVFLESGDQPLHSLVARFARSRGPFTTADANEHFGRDVELELRALEREETLVRGELRPGGTEREWCDPDVLRRLRRASLAALRKEVEPAEQATLGRFLPSGTGSTGGRLCARRSSRCRRCRSRCRCGSPRCCRGACPATGPSCSTSFARPARSSGSGAGLDRVALFFREDAAVLGRPSAASAPEGEAHERCPGGSEDGRAVLVRSARRHRARGRTALAALWDLVWAGEVTNDAWQPLRAGRRYGIPQARAPAAPFLAPRAHRRDGDAGALVARRPPLRRTSRTGARSPSCCSSDRGSSPVTASAGRGSPAATGPSTAS